MIEFHLFVLILVLVLVPKQKEEEEEEEEEQKRLFVAYRNFELILQVFVVFLEDFFP
jgi:hypothetical protein